MSMIQALAMTVAEIPVFLYTTFGQVEVGLGCGPALTPLGSRTPSPSSQGPQHLGKLVRYYCYPRFWGSLVSAEQEGLG